MAEKTKIPLLGLGTYKLQGAECEEVIRKGYDLGYRHIDTADAYENHTAVGRAIKKLPREEIFLTTKLYINDLTKERVEAKVPQFLKELGVDTLDLLLIHWPNKDVPLQETLDAMLSFKEKGVVKAIGVSNFVRKHLEELKAYKGEILTNQVEMHPYLQREALKKAYLDAGISITAYRPVAKGAFKEDATLNTIGKKYGKTATQIALIYLVQNGIAVIPKAASDSHLRENSEIFDCTLTADECQSIRKLDAHLRFCAPEGLPVYDD